MNHLVGLKGIPDPTMDLPLEDAKILNQFRSDYYAKKPAKGADHVPLTHQISSTSILPECGWRPLDDATLYRFLCADRDNKTGQFSPEESMQRILNALQFRRDHKVDEILNVGVVETRSAASTGTTVGVTAASLLVGSFAPKVTVTRGPRKVNFKAQPSLLKKQDSFTSITTATTASTTSMPPPSIRPPSSLTPQDVANYQRWRVRVFVGRDKQGNPVLFERLGEFFGAGHVPKFTFQEWIALYIWDLERHLPEMRQASIEAGKPIDKYVYFGDMNGVVRSIMGGSIWPVIPLLKALVKTVEDHYPEIVSHVVVFNVPKIGMAVWEVIRKFLDPVTAAKVQLCAGFPKELALQLIDEDCLPVEYGGNNNRVNYPKTAKK